MSVSLRSWLVSSACALGCSLGAAGLAGCATDNSDAEFPASAGESEAELRSLVVTQDDHGRRVRIAEGETLTVELPENAANGYRWTVTRTDRSLGYPYRTRYFAPEEGAGGAGGRRRFYWRTTGAFPLVGAHDIQLSLVRASGEAKDVVDFTVEIDEVE